MNLYRSRRWRAPDVANLEGYARRAVLNEFLRRRRLRSANDIITADVPESAAAPFDDAVLERDRIWTALGRLPARQRAVLVLRFYEDLPDSRIAQLIDAREATVRSLAARGLANLRATAALRKAETS